MFRVNTTPWHRAGGGFQLEEVMSLRLTRKGFITSLDHDPSMAGLRAYWAGRRWYRDDGGHGTGSAGGDDDTGDDADADDDDTDADAEDDDDDETAKDKKKGGKKDDEDDEESVPKWKYDKLHTRMQAADRNATELRKQLEELKKSADIPADVKRELEEIKSKVGTIEKERDDIAEDRDKLRVKVAALSLSGDGIPEWEDVEVALGLADLSDVEVSDAGKVDKRALKSALKTLAKEKPYLVKKKTKSTSTDDNEAGTGTNTKMNGRRKGEGQQRTREDLAKAFPALNRIG